MNSNIEEYINKDIYRENLFHCDWLTFKISDLYECRGLFDAIFSGGEILDIKVRGKLFDLGASDDTLEEIINEVRRLSVNRKIVAIRSRKECKWVLDFVFQYHKGYDRLLKIDINYAIIIKPTFDLNPYSILYSLIKESIIHHFRKNEVLRVNDNGTCTVELSHDGNIAIKLFGYEVNLTKEGGEITLNSINKA